MFVSRMLTAASLAALTACMTTEEAVPAGPSTAAVATETPPAPPAEASRYVHQVDVPSTVRPFLSPQGFLDPAFPPTIAAPSHHLTDFFGHQAIADIPRDRIVADLVPAHAQLVSQDDHSVTLQFPRGYTATFYPISALAMMGVSAPYSHVYISGDDWRTKRANLADFIGVLESAGLAGRYLIPNPFYEDEVTTAAQMRSGRHAPVTIDPQAALFFRTPNAILLKPEYVHGIRESADELMQLLRRGAVDWVGLEMLPSGMQDELDAFHRAQSGTPEYRQGRQKLIDYFAENWNGRAGPRTTGEENYYFQLVDLARQRGVRVIGLEQAFIHYIIFRYGETPFGGSVRSYQWSKAVPATGRGVIFGGSAHFNLPEPTNVQDFIAARQPDRAIMSLRDLHARPRS